jgi:hypothetical protein
VDTVAEDIERVDPVEEESEQATVGTESAGEPVESSLQNIGHNRIAFIDPKGRLVTINPDGSDRRVLT